MTCLSSSCVFCANECAPAHCVCVGAAAAGGVFCFYTCVCHLCVCYGDGLPNGSAPLEWGGGGACFSYYYYTLSVHLFDAFNPINSAQVLVLSSLFILFTSKSLSYSSRL